MDYKKKLQEAWDSAGEYTNTAYSLINNLETVTSMSHSRFFGHHFVNIYSY